MFCEQCGRQLEEGSKFCPGCGSAVGGVSQEIRQSWQDSSYQPQEYIRPIQPNPQMEVAKKQAETAKNIFFSILVKPVSTLEQVMEMQDKIPAFMVGGIHLAVLFLFTTIHIL